MRARTALVSIVVIAAAMAAGGAALQAAGIHPPGTPPAGTAPSGAWFCPHGGGPKWSAKLWLTNPGRNDVHVRVSSYGQGPGAHRLSLSIPPGSVRDVPVPAADRGQASMVEYSGGWIAAGWVARAGKDESGVAAEPCLPRAGRSWLLPDGTTEKGQDAYVVVMNPFASESVFSVTLVTERRTVRPKEWTNFVLGAGRSIALHLNDNALGEKTVATEIDVSIGRVAAASLGVAEAGGIRGGIGMPSPAREIVLPGAADAGPSEVSLLDPGSAAARYSVSVLSGSGRRPAPDLVGQQLGPGSDRTEHVNASGSAVLVQSSEAIAAARRSFGLKGDQGSVSGGAAAGAWVVSTAAASSSHEVRVYLANPGRRNVRIEVFEVSSGGGGRSARRTVEVPAGTTVQIPSHGGSPQASIVALATAGTFVPVEASYSTSGAGYAVATGVPIPPRWVPKG